MADGDAPSFTAPVAKPKRPKRAKPNASPAPAELSVWLSREKAAELLDCSTATIRRRERDGSLPAYTDGRMTRYLRADVMGLLQPKTDMHRLAHASLHRLTVTVDDLVAVASVDGVPTEEPPAVEVAQDARALAREQARELLALDRDDDGGADG